MVSFAFHSLSAAPSSLHYFCPSTSVSQGAEDRLDRASEDLGLSPIFPSPAHIWFNLWVLQSPPCIKLVLLLVKTLSSTREMDSTSQQDVGPIKGFYKVKGFFLILWKMWLCFPNSPQILLWWVSSTVRIIHPCLYMQAMFLKSTDTTSFTFQRRCKLPGPGIRPHHPWLYTSRPRGSKWH